MSPSEAFDAAERELREPPSREHHGSARIDLGRVRLVAEEAALVEVRPWS